MTTFKDTIQSVMSVVTDDEPKGPMHVGEVMNLWLYLGILEEANRFVEIGLNSTTDEELIQILKHSFKDCKEQIKKITDLFKEEGIPLPPTSEIKPHSNPNDVPLGAKMTDDEIANGVSLKLVTAITACARGFTESIRVDIGNLWAEFLFVRIKFGGYLTPILRKRGWIKVPPYYYASIRKEQ